MSRAVALRQATLRLAARKGADLNLSRSRPCRTLCTSHCTAAADAFGTRCCSISTPAQRGAHHAAAQAHGLTVMAAAALPMPNFQPMCLRHP